MAKLREVLQALTVVYGLERHVLFSAGLGAVFGGFMEGKGYHFRLGQWIHLGYRRMSRRELYASERGPRTGPRRARPGRPVAQEGCRFAR